MKEIASTCFHNSLKLTEHSQTSVQLCGGESLINGLEKWGLLKYTHF